MSRQDALASTLVVAPAAVSVPPSLPQSPPAQSVQSAAPYPLSPTGGYSVLQALRVARPASALFWAGLSGIVTALICCPLGAGVMLLNSGAAEESSSFRVTVLSFSTCLFFLVLAVAGIFVFAGRPRRTL